MQILQVSGRDVVPLEDGALLVDDLVEPQAGVEIGLDALEDRDRAVSTSTTANNRGCQ